MTQAPRPPYGSIGRLNLVLGAMFAVAAVLAGTGAVTFGVDDELRPVMAGALGLVGVSDMLVGFFFLRRDGTHGH